MPDKLNNQKDEDESISEALSSLGWVEEKEETEKPITEEENLQEQLDNLNEQNRKLNEQIVRLSEELEKRGNDYEFLLQENDKLQQLADQNNTTIENLLQTIVKKDDFIKELEMKIDVTSEPTQSEVELNKIVESKNQEINQLNEQLESFRQEIEKLNSSIKDKNQLMQDHTNKIDKLNDKIQEQIKENQTLTKELEQLNSEQSVNKDLVEKLNEKDNKLKELLEQVQYLEKDTVQKSKFDKLQLLLEKKDEVITEKEKTIFSTENNLETANKKLKELQQQVETFSLVKKDLEKKEERIKELVLEIEKFTQKDKTREEYINRIEKQLEESQEKSGNIIGKVELEIASLRNIIEEQTNEIKDLKKQEATLKNKLYEAEQIEDRILGEMQNVKDSRLKLQSEIEKKDIEIIELKKKIKLMRRDLQKP
ncbi:MAG: hypothetical protein ACFFEO_08440 [Candidatus Thorarchaeota archaeon]